MWACSQPTSSKPNIYVNMQLGKYTCRPMYSKENKMACSSAPDKPKSRGRLQNTMGDACLLCWPTSSLENVPGYCGGRPASLTRSCFPQPTGPVALLPKKETLRASCKTRDSRKLREGLRPATPSHGPPLLKESSAKGGCPRPRTSVTQGKRGEGRLFLLLSLP